MRMYSSPAPVVRITRMMITNRIFGCGKALKHPLPTPIRPRWVISTCAGRRTAANLLTWAGWAADEDDAFDIFRVHFKDKPGYVYDALKYYFANYEAGVSAEMVTVRETRSHMLLDFIVSAVHKGKGAAIKIAHPAKKFGHFLTIYGYGYNAGEDSFVLYFTDSDDGLHRIRQFKVEWNDANDRWKTQYLYHDYYLVYALSLARS